MKPIIILMLFGLIGGVICEYLLLDANTRMGLRELQPRQRKRSHGDGDVTCREKCPRPHPPYEPFCATNGRTYLTECLMGCDRTGQFGLFKIHDGPC